VGSYSLKGWIGFFRNVLGKLFKRLGTARIRNQSFFDLATDTLITIDPGETYYVVSVGEGHYYFYAVSGKNGGTRTMLCRGTITTAGQDK
jgi:hypothetical protein